MARACGTIGGGGERNSKKVLMGRSEGGKQLGRPRRRWKDNIKMDPKKWIARAWTRLIWFRIWTSGRLL
jgi:hypothetical protein